MKVKNFLKGKRGVYSFMAGALVVLLLLAGLPACAPATEEEAAYDNYVASLPEGCFPVPQDCFEQAIEEGQLNIYDWAEWWPEEIYSGFSQEFGIEIVRDNFASEPEVLAKFKLNPEMPYDMITGLGIRTVFQMIQLDTLQELNHDWIPNVTENIDGSFLEFEYDPGAKYSIFSDYSFDSYWYNTNRVDDARIPSWSAFFDPDEKYEGKITVVDDMFRVTAAALAYLGYPIDSDNEEELMAARDVLMELKPSIMTFDSWPKRLALEGEAWMCQGNYSDGFMMNQESDGVVTSGCPPEGSRLGTEIMSIPIGAPHPAAAHLWLNYVYRPQVSALLCGTIGYGTANSAAVDLLPEAMMEWWKGVPEGYVSNCQVITAKALTGKGLELRTQIWEELKG